MHLIDKKLSKYLKPMGGKKVIIVANNQKINADMYEDEILGMVNLASNIPSNLISLGQLLNNGWKEFTDKNLVKRIKKNEHTLTFYPKGNLWIMDDAMIAMSNESNSSIIKKFVDLHERLGHRSNEGIRKIIESGVLKTDFKLEDYDWAVKNAEKCIACIQGKSVIKKKTNSSRIKSNKLGEIFHVDLFDYRKLKFMLAVDEATGFVYIKNIKSKDKKELKDIFIGMINYFRSFNKSFKLKKIYSDREGAILALKDFFNNKGIRLFPCAAEQHDGMSERFIRSLKDMARTIEASLSYHIHPDMIIHLINYCSQCINVNTNTHLLEKGSTPWFELTNEIIDYDKFFKVQFGEVLLFNVCDRNSKGSHTPKMEWGIVLSRDIDSTGVIKVKLLNNNEIVSRNNFKRPDNVSKSILELLNQDGIETVEEIVINNKDQTYKQNKKNDSKVIIKNNNKKSYLLRPRKNKIVKNLEKEIAMMTYNEACKISKSKTEEGLAKELYQLIDKNVFEAIKKEDIGSSQVIKLILIFAQKGDKIKARIVANGAKQDLKEYMPWEVTASTASIASILTIISTAVIRDLKLHAMDITGAYLNAFIEKRIVVHFDQNCTKRLINISPKYSDYVQEDGSMFGVLTKALYGLKESATLWQNNLTSTFKELGYETLKQDPNIIKKNENVGAIYVDDIIMGFSSLDEKDNVINGLESKYGKIKMESNNFKYRGLEISQSPGLIVIKQSEYINKLLKEYNIRKVVVNPPLNILKDDDSEELKDKNVFSKLMAKLLWLSTQSRPDIKIHTSLLCTKLERPSERDFKNALKILQYLHGTRNIGLMFSKGSAQLTASIDSSFGMHRNSESHSGVVIKMGNNLLSTISKKQKLVSNSSAESELYALDTGINDILFLREILNELGFKQDTTIIEQDNIATIKIANTPAPTQRTKHIKRRNMRIKQHIDSKEIELVHVGDEFIMADIMTKPLIGSKFAKSRDNLLGITNSNMSKIVKIGEVC